MQAARRRSVLPLIALACALSAACPVRAVDSPWSGWSFLLGEWVGSGAGTPGMGEGAFTFALDLQDTVIVRRNHNELRGTGERPAAIHDDLMICYREAGGATRADYFDNEGHVIRYTATLSADGKSLVFVSDVPPGAPGFRLTYSRKDDGALGIRFEVAPPGHPKDFQTYLEGSAIRKGAAPAHP